MLACSGHTAGIQKNDQMNQLNIELETNNHTQEGLTLHAVRDLTPADTETSCTPMNVQAD